MNYNFINQFSEFFFKLFDVSDWPPRWQCGEWSDFHGWLYIFSDVSIWLAYFIIPVIIVWYVQKRPDIPFVSFFWLFGAFIVLCGTTHIIDAIIFWWPAYRISALARFFTALVSFLTVFALIRELPGLLKVKNFQSFEMEQELRLNAQEQSQRLEKELNHLRSLLNAKEDDLKNLNLELEKYKNHI